VGEQPKRLRYRKEKTQLKRKGGVKKKKTISQYYSRQEEVGTKRGNARKAWRGTGPQGTLSGEKMLSPSPKKNPRPTRKIFVAPKNGGGLIPPRERPRVKDFEKDDKTRTERTGPKWKESKAPSNQCELNIGQIQITPPKKRMIQQKKKKNCHQQGN